jgi:hypothetical protein
LLFFSLAPLSAFDFGKPKQLHLATASPTNSRLRKFVTPDASHSEAPTVCEVKQPLLCRDFFGGWAIEVKRLYAVI